MQTAQPSEGEPPGLYMRGLLASVALVARHPWWTLAIGAALTLAAAIYSSGAVRMNSDDRALISQDEPFRQDYARFLDSFPQFEETSLVVVTSASIDRADDAVDRLSEALAARDDLVATLYAPSAEDFFEDHGFLYLEEDELYDAIERLAEAQPVLAAMAEDPSLRGLFEQLELSLDELEEEGELPKGYTRMVDRIDETVASMQAGRPRRIGWADELLVREGDVYRVIVIQGRVHFEEKIATGRLIDGIRQIVQELGLTPENGVRVRMTGMVPLAHEEQESLQRGLLVAGVVATALLSVILGFGVRSLRIIVATFVTLVASLSWTTAYAMLSVGEFNIISAAFAVLLIGLGVDFAVHLGLQYEEETRRGAPVPEALRRATEHVGGAVSICALTSAIGFLSFVPTRYYGLGALGIIAGGGMFISLVASFTVFPALLALMRAPSRHWPEEGGLLDQLHSWLVGRAGTVVAISAGLAVVAVGLSLRMTFDYSTLGMKDPDSESMTTLRELQAEDIITDYTATLLAGGLAEAARLAERLEELDLVSEVRSPGSYVPEDQESKLEAIEDASFFLDSALHPDLVRPPPTPAERVAAVDALRARIGSMSPPDASDEAWRATLRLKAGLDAIAGSADPEATALQLEELVISDLTDRLEWLRRALSVGEIGFDDLPASLRERIVGRDGTVQVVALPLEDMSDVLALSRFVDAVAEIDPHATGRPAVEAGIGAIVVDTFRTAITIALLAVLAILLWSLRSPLDALMVLLPITLAAFFTVAVGVLIGMRFNMANVVVVPLILGLGVDSGVHVFMRFRRNGSLGGMMRSSTPRAVVLSALTTLAAFGSLAVSEHRGIHSMGVLLSVAVLCLLVCTLIVLPALIAVRQRFSRRSATSAPPHE